MKRFLKAALMTVFLTLLLAVPVQAGKVMEGIDVSNYNKTVDWEQVKNQGKKFVMIRTGEGLYTGTDDSDVQFEANYRGAGTAGIKRGVYHMAYRTTVAEARKEAEYCLKILDGRKLEYPVAYDIERAQVLATGKKNVTAMAKAFCDVIKKAGYVPMIYSSSYYLNNYFDWKQLEGVKVWVAEYGVEKPSFKGVYHMWQYSDEGVVSGANTDQGICDLNQSYFDNAQSIELSTGTKNLGIKQSFTLKAKVTPANCWETVKFTSSDRSVATVTSKGVVTALKNGKVTITARAGDASASCKVTIKAPNAITLPKKKITLKKGGSYIIKPKVVNGAYCYKYSYTSGKKSVATVTSKGVVKARGRGKAVITVKTFNGKTARLTVTVK